MRKLLGRLDPVDSSAARAHGRRAIWSPGKGTGRGLPGWERTADVRVPADGRDNGGALGAEREHLVVVPQECCGVRRAGVHLAAVAASGQYQGTGRGASGLYGKGGPACG